MKKHITLLILLALIFILAISQIIAHIKETLKPEEVEVPVGAAITEQDPNELEVDLSIEEENEDVSIDK